VNEEQAKITEMDKEENIFEIDGGMSVGSKGSDAK